MSLRTERAVLRAVEGFAPMRERLVCEKRLRPEAPGTEPCFLAELGEMFGATSWRNFRWAMRAVQCMLVLSDATVVSVVVVVVLVWLSLVWRRGGRRKGPSLRLLTFERCTCQRRSDRALLGRRGTVWRGISRPGGRFDRCAKEIPDGDTT